MDRNEIFNSPNCCLIKTRNLVIKRKTRECSIMFEGRINRMLRLEEMYDNNLEYYYNEKVAEQILWETCIALKDKL